MPIVFVCVCAVFSAGTSQEDIHNIQWQSPSMILATFGRNMFWTDVGRVASHRTSRSSKGSCLKLSL